MVNEEFVVRPADAVMCALARAGFDNITAAYFDEGTTTIADLTFPVDTLILSAQRRA